MSGLPAHRPRDGRAPTDEEAERVWVEIMRLAAGACLVVQAYGGVATLAVPAEQRRAGIRRRVLDAHECEEHNFMSTRGGRDG